MGVSISKSESNVEVYYIRGARFGNWADIIIDANGNKGRLCIASSQGNWGYYWGSCGCPFMEFICDLDIGYVSRKFGADSFFDLEATIKEWKSGVLEARREKDIEAEKARRIYDEIKSIESEQPTKEAITIMFWNNEILMDWFYDSPDLATKVEPAFLFFWEEMWEPFVAQLKNKVLETV